MNVMKKSSKTLVKSARAIPSSPKARDFDEVTFAEISKLISASRERALLSVNTVLIDLYWKVGEHISRKIAAAEWGDGVVSQLAQYVARTQPGLRGFTRDNLFRMKQFLRDILWRGNSRGTGPTIAVDSQFDHPRAEQAT